MKLAREMYSVIALCLALSSHVSAVSMGALRGKKANSVTVVHSVVDMEDTHTESTSAAIQSIISGKGSPMALIKSTSKKMSTAEAIKQLKNKLPAEVASLVNVAATGGSRASFEFTEVSLAKARNILNGMILNSWIELDDKVIECKEFEERNRGTIGQVQADLTRLAAQIADLQKIMGDSNNGIEDADRGRGSTETEMSNLYSAYMAIRLVNEAEMAKRRSDLAVFDFILNMTRCVGSSFLQVHGAAPGFQMCENNNGLELVFDDQHIQSKLQSMMTPAARKMIQQSLGMTGLEPPSESEVALFQKGHYHGKKHRAPAPTSMGDCLLQNYWRTEDQVAAMSNDDKRNTVIVEFVKAMFGTVQEMQAKSDNELLAMCPIALDKCLTRNNWRSITDLGAMTDDDKRNTIITEFVNMQMGTVEENQGLNNAQLLQKCPDPPPQPELPPTAMPPTVPPVTEPAGGQWKKCNDGKANCGLLHDTMSLQWGKFKDLVDDLQVTMTKNENAYLTAKSNLNDQLVMYTEQKASMMTALSEATSKANADRGETNDKSIQRRELQHEYEKKMKECDNKISEILFTNICAVKKVRNEVMTFSSVTPPSKISDCDVKDWVPADCTHDCDDACPQPDPYQCGGWQMLSREIVVNPNTYGIQCPPLARKKKCNQFKCPVDCGMSMWTSWSKCTKECEGGVQGKTRAVIVRPKNGGEMCDTVQEERSCETGSCDRDCTLHPWTDWSPCSMACSGGVQDRIRTVLVPIRGDGKCPKRKSSKRYEVKECNTQDCYGDEICIANQDLVLLVDSSGSLREEGFALIRSFVANLTDFYQSSIKGDEDRIRLAAVLFGNGNLEADGTITPALRLHGLTNETYLVRQSIEASTWQRGFTNLAQGFVLADTVLQQGGRPEAQSAVMVIWDGKYSFAFETGQKAKMLKDKNVQIYMAPIADSLGEEQTKAAQKWASKPWETNYEHIPGLEALENNQETYIQKVIVKFCPNSFSPSQQQKMDDLAGFTKIKISAVPDPGCSSIKKIGMFATRDECFAAAQESGAQIFIFDKRWRNKNSSPCSIAPDFEQFDFATYESWTRLPIHDHKHQFRYAPVTCPGGNSVGQDNDKFVDGWQKLTTMNTYAIKPAID